MNDQIESLRTTFKAYISQETDTVSLRGFLEYAPDILTTNTGVRNLKDYWNAWFKKIVAEMKIQKYSNCQPGWDSLKSQSLGKRGRNQSTASSSAPSQSSTRGSSSAATQNTETTNKRRKKLAAYISEKTPPEVTLDTEIEEWVIADVPISQTLVDYRKTTIEKAKHEQLDTYHEELWVSQRVFVIDGLGCIFPSSQREYGFDVHTWDAMVEQYNKLYPVDSLREETAATITKLSKVIKKNFKQCKSIVNKIAEDDDSIKESLKSMLSLYSPKASTKTDQNESTFSLTAVYPVILSFLPESDLTTTNGTDGKTLRKDSESTSKKGYQFSDLSVSFAYGKMPEQALLIVEIKPPHKVRTGSRPDLVKLANETKDAIDKMISDGIDDQDITVLGILVEGFRCTLFVMDLKYQAIYRLIPLSEFYIPRDRHDFCLLIDSYEALTTMQASEFTDFAKREK